MSEHPRPPWRWARGDFGRDPSDVLGSGQLRTTGTVVAGWWHLPADTTASLPSLCLTFPLTWQLEVAGDLPFQGQVPRVPRKGEICLLHLRHPHAKRLPPSHMWKVVGAPRGGAEPGRPVHTCPVCEDPGILVGCTHGPTSGQLACESWAILRLSPGLWSGAEVGEGSAEGRIV